MKDNEIIKALVYCNEGSCCACPYQGREDVVDCAQQLGIDILDLINRQMAEIKQKDTEIDILIRKKEALQDKVEELRYIIERIYKQLKELEFLVEMMEVNENA